MFVLYFLPQDHCSYFCFRVLRLFICLHVLSFHIVHLFALFISCLLICSFVFFFVAYPFLYQFGKGRHLYVVAVAIWPACIIREWKLISSGIVRTGVWAELQVISGVLLGGTSQSLEHASQGGVVLATGFCPKKIPGCVSVFCMNESTYCV